MEGGTTQNGRGGGAGGGSPHVLGAKSPPPSTSALSVSTPGSPSSGPAQTSPARQTSNIKSSCQQIEAALVVLVSFASSVALINSTKWIYVYEGFKYPFFVTMTHSLFSYALAAFVTSGEKPWMRRTHKLQVREQVTKILPFTIFGSLSIACGNAALVFLYPSFHEMIQNTTPFWTLIVMVTLGGTRYNSWSYLAMIPVCGGGVLCGIGEMNFHVVGIIISIGSAVFRALRVLVQAKVLCDLTEPMSSITLLYYSSPWSMLFYLFAGILFEGSAPWRIIFFHEKQNLSNGVPGSASAADPASLASETSSAAASSPSYLAGTSASGIFGMIIFTGVIAAVFNLSAFLMVARLGALTAMAIGNLKNFAIIFSSVILFGNSCTMLQVVGFFTICFGVWLNSQVGKEIRVQQEPGADPGGSPEKDQIKNMVNPIGALIETARSRITTRDPRGKYMDIKNSLAGRTIAGIAAELDEDDKYNDADHGAHDHELLGPDEDDLLRGPIDGGGGGRRRQQDSK